MLEVEAVLLELAEESAVVESLEAAQPAMEYTMLMASKVQRIRFFINITPELESYACFILLGCSV